MFRKPALLPNNNNDIKTYNIYCIICYMLCDRNNSIVFRVAREYVKKETLYNEFSNNIMPWSIQNNLLTHTKRT